ncbi:MAG: hypothetical protein P8O10_02725, partial [Pseudorhodobacter sp.]|nr:hypothetical protein [Pseudorhodobacter sp.]
TKAENHLENARNLFKQTEPPLLGITCKLRQVGMSDPQALYAVLYCVLEGTGIFRPPKTRRAP